MSSSSPIRLEAAALDSYLERQVQALADRVLVLRALPGSYLHRFGVSSLRCAQTWKPDADALLQLGVELVTETAGPVDLAVVFGTKHKEETLFHFAQAVEALEEGGTFIGVAANGLGAPSLEKRCGELLGGIASYSKHKCRVFRATKDAARLNQELLRQWLALGEWRTLPDSGLYTRAGVFGGKQTDPGSRLLAGFLPMDLSGRGADLGAGYGYLSHALLAGKRAVAELHLFEGEKKALEAAERNLAEYAGAGKPRLHFHWADVTRGLPVRNLDFVVMNPPFHAGRDAVPSLGRTFVQVALTALRPGGRLFLVANRKLPYENELDSAGGRLLEMHEGGGYKALAAVKA